MKKISNICLTFLGYSGLIFNIFNFDSIKADECSHSIDNKVVAWSINKIKNSDMATNNTFSCEQVKEMNSMNSDQISITSGRKRGQATICISDESNYPCKFIIGIIEPQFDSATALSEIYSFTPPKSSQLNETVERLFLKPSSLIQ